jgi:hypothetical protein
VKAASDIFAPVSGTITEVNTKLSDQAGLLNKSPEDEGTYDSQIAKLSPRTFFYPSTNLYLDCFAQVGWPRSSSPLPKS